MRYEDELDEPQKPKSKFESPKADKRSIPELPRPVKRSSTDVQARKSKSMSKAIRGD